MDKRAIGPTGARRYYHWPETTPVIGPSQQSSGSFHTALTLDAASRNTAVDSHTCTVMNGPSLAAEKPFAGSRDWRQGIPLALSAPH
jgi:hypothetical protein